VKKLCADGSKPKNITVLLVDKIQHGLLVSQRKRGDPDGIPAGCFTAAIAHAWHVRVKAAQEPGDVGVSPTNCLHTALIVQFWQASGPASSSRWPHST
jgi:hypothetical protein